MPGSRVSRQHLPNLESPKHLFAPEGAKLPEIQPNLVWFSDGASSSFSKPALIRHPKQDFNQMVVFHKRRVIQIGSQRAKRSPIDTLDEDISEPVSAR